MILDWQPARLLPPSIGLFTDSFYPPKNKAGNQVVYWAPLPCTHTNYRVAICPDLTNPGKVRTVTVQLASTMLAEFVRSLTKDEKASLEIVETLSDGLRPYLRAHHEEAEEV